MAIKLADVIERNHVSYPVIEAHDKTIVGFYNGASADAQQPLALYYNSSTKTSLSSDGTAGNTVKLTALPYGGDGGANTAGAGDSLVVPTEKGGIITMLDEKLLTDLGGHPSPTDYVAAYLVNVANDGSNNDTGRSSVGRLSELVQQFNRYQTTTVESAQVLSETEGENFWLAGYHTEEQVMKKLDLDALLGFIGSQLMGVAVSEGLITASNAGETDEDSGVFGDLNGDGAVSTADLLQFLGEFGQGPQANAFNATVKALAGSAQETAEVGTVIATPSAASNTQFVASDFDSFEYPVTNTLDILDIGYNQSLSVPSSGTAFMELSGITLTSANDSFFAEKTFHFFVDAVVNFSAADILYMLVEVEYTTTASDVYNELYHMGINFAPLTGAGLIAGGAYAIGLDHEITFTFQSGVGTGFSNSNSAVSPSSLGTYNHGSNTPIPLPPIKLDTQLGGNYIESVKFTPVFTSLTSSTTVKATETRIQLKVPV